VCEAQETLTRFSQQIPFGVLKLDSAFSRTCCQLVESIPASQQASGMFYECPLQTGDDTAYQTETASDFLYFFYFF
jgi:hypothetical protein